MVSKGRSRGVKALALVAIGAALGAGPAPGAGAADGRKTVCTITINSADEKMAFARHLPASRYRFVELAQPGRPDWLGEACQAGVRCDVLVVSGHYDGGNAFFSDAPEAPDGNGLLGVSELERAACSDRCRGVFAQLQEVYLFGCNTLNPLPTSSAGAEQVRSLVREREARAGASRELLRLGTVYGESSRERMRQVFAGVPAIYGFPAAAPLGPAAAAALDRHFRATGAPGAAAIGTGRPNARLLEQFAASGLTLVHGVDPGQTQGRWNVCQFMDERLPDAQLARHLHRLLRRDTPELVQHLDRMQRLARDLASRQPPSAALAIAWRDIQEDFISRLRLLEAAQQAAEPGARVRMIDLASTLGWLTPAERRRELARMFGTFATRPEHDLGQIALACTLNRGHGLDGLLDGAGQTLPDDLPRAAVRACLGSAESRQSVLAALASPVEAEVQTAQAYLRQQPVRDGSELHGLVASVARMPPSPAQVRALEALARQDVGQAPTVALLTELYAQTSDADVQAAVAGVLLRVDRRLLAEVGVPQVLRERRLASPNGDGKIDALLGRLQAP